LEGSTVSGGDLFGLILGLIVLAYLFYVLVRPERF
jgi:K+-transporting ATPase KdpF subunit